MYRRRPRYRIIFPLLAALLLSALVTAALARLGITALAIVVFLLLAIIFFILLGLVPTRVVTSPPPPPWLRPRGPGGRRGSGDGSGVREPRRPRPPYMPPMAEELDPDHLPTS